MKPVKIIEIYLLSFLESENYLANYAKIPGKALVVDAIDVKSQLSEEDCAKECSTRDDIECLSFDLCTDVGHNWAGKSILEK